MLEQMYNDFTTKLLPQINEGLVITKEYFTDLFGRYIKYLIIQDSLILLLSIVFLVVAILVAKNLYLKHDDWEREDYDVKIILSFAAILFCGVLGTILFTDSSLKIAKDIYIPEVRVYEELRELKLF